MAPKRSSTKSGRPGAGVRADAARNRERLLRAAADAFATHGVEAPLEEVARRAGVGIGTLYRHFPTREALIRALFASDVAALTAHARALAGARSPRRALEEWLLAFVEHVTSFRGLAGSVAGGLCSGGETSTACGEMVAAGGALLEQARKAGAVRAGVAPADVIALANAIGWSAEHAAGDAGHGARLLRLVMEGLRP